jgi:hypothetical protein
VRGVVVVAFALLIAPVGAAQVPARAASFEARMDGILSRSVVTTHLGFGVARPTSRNLELQFALGAGVALSEDEDPRPSARADALARFAPPLASPNAWGAYASAGVGALVERGARGRALLLLLVGVRGRGTFFEAGLGGGLRLGMGVRF